MNVFSQQKESTNSRNHANSRNTHPISINEYVSLNLLSRTRKLGHSTMELRSLIRRYSQWRSRFLRYIDTKPNGGGLKKCILNGPYVPTSVLIQAVPEAEGRPAVQQHEHLKQTYKDLFDSIKRTRVQTKNQNDSLMEQLNKRSNENADVLAQIQKKGFAIAALKNELRKLTGSSVNTKFAKPSILGKPVGQPLKNQSVVRQPTAFKSERPKISKERFASQVDVSNNLSKPVTTHYLPKRRESAPAKPHYMIAPISS
ncbi:hypothetical protein Tco_0755597, partial [Tanacetum coccineum]